MLAGLQVTTKAVEHAAEATGHDIAQRQQQEIQRAVQLDLGMVVGEPTPSCICRWTALAYRS